MGARKNPYEYRPEYYVQGSTARKLNTVQPLRQEPETEPVRKEPVRRHTPRREPDRYERIRKQEEERSSKKLVQIDRSVNFFGMLLLTAAIALTVFCCIDYLQLTAEQNRLDKSITALQEELGLLVDANQAKTNRLTEGIDMDVIYQTAVADLGMVFPNNNEIIYYQQPDTGYVRQYADIPEVAISILDELIP
ncbi:MAG: hypothetical protein IJY09_03490 [Lachnospiraceae bacterium]|nr:hypothetical protein [Lachnospiraceae bacterium]